MKRWFAIIVALQVAFIAAEWGKYTVQAETGQKVVLRARQADPRSLFMGNYMALSLTIDSLDPRTLANTTHLEDLTEGTTVYVGLKPGGTYARPVSLSASIPSPRPSGIVYMRGKVVMTTTERVRDRDVVKYVQVDYGIDRYYFPEDRQQELMERTRWRDGRPVDIFVTVSIADSGEAILQKLTVDGQTVEF